MLKKLFVGYLILATSMVFGMSLSKLNSATKAELMEINGIGDAKASAIIKERKKGKFKSFDDFQRVEGIGAQTAANVKNNVKSASDVKKVKKTTKKKSTSKTKASKKDTKEKSKKETKKKKTSKSTKDKKTKKKKESTTKSKTKN